MSSATGVHERFVERLTEIRRVQLSPRELELDATLGVGALIGAGLPGAAAALARLYELAAGESMSTEYVPRRWSD